MFLMADGTEFPAEVKASQLKDKDGNPAGLIARITVITERKQIEEERAKAAKLESIDTLAGGIAHDFNNILTGITGYIGLAKRSVERGDVRCSGVRTSAASASAVTNRLDA